MHEFKGRMSDLIRQAGCSWAWRRDWKQRGWFISLMCHCLPLSLSQFNLFLCSLVSPTWKWCHILWNNSMEQREPLALLIPGSISHPPPCSLCWTWHTRSLQTCVSASSRAIFPKGPLHCSLSLGPSLHDPVHRSCSRLIALLWPSADRSSVKSLKKVTTAAPGKVDWLWELALSLDRSPCATVLECSHWDQEAMPDEANTQNLTNFYEFSRAFVLLYCAIL